jgi:hypothetical protein
LIVRYVVNIDKSEDVRYVVNIDKSEDHFFYEILSQDNLLLMVLSRYSLGYRDFPTELMDFIQRHPIGRALDLDCGTGINVITYARREWQIAGLDFARQSG